MLKEKILTPCINVCTLDIDNKLCQGCYRTLEEIKDWMAYTKEKRQHLMLTTIPQRKNLRNTADHDIVYTVK